MRKTKSLLMMTLMVAAFLASATETEKTRYHFLVEPTLGLTSAESEFYTNLGLDLEILAPDDKLGVGILYDREYTGPHPHQEFLGLTGSYLFDNQFKLTLGAGSVSRESHSSSFFRLALGYEVKRDNEDFFLIPTLVSDHKDGVHDISLILGFAWIL